MRTITTLLLLLALVTPLRAQDQMNMPPDIAWVFRNFTNPGSCVQCSVGMCGWWQNEPAATYLVYDTEYG